MTTQDLINYYANLLILQYVGKPRAYATIQTVVNPVVMDQLPTQVQDAFDPATAVGVQLDIIGKYAGVTRNGYTIGGSPVTLTDPDFRSLITFAIIKNNSGSSLATIQALIHQYFPGEVFIFDTANMQLAYIITTAAGSMNLIELLITEGLLPKPMGVGVSSIIVLNMIGVYAWIDYRLEPTVYSGATNYSEGALVFDANYITYESLISNNLGNPLNDTTAWQLLKYPFNSYASYNTNAHWLSYADAITI